MKIEKDDDLVGKTVMSKEGFIIGKIIDIPKKKRVKEIRTTLVKPTKKINLHTFKINEKGNIVLPLKSLTKVKNIFIFEEPNKKDNKRNKSVSCL